MKYDRKENKTIRNGTIQFTDARTVNVRATREVLKNRGDALTMR